MQYATVRVYLIGSNSNPCSLACEGGALDPTKVKGKILVCLRGENDRLDKGRHALLAGAVGMILANDAYDGNGILSDAHFLPASNINYTDAQQLFSYIKSTKYSSTFTF